MSHLIDGDCFLSHPVLSSRDRQGVVVEMHAARKVAAIHPSRAALTSHPLSLIERLILHRTPVDRRDFGEFQTSLWLVTSLAFGRLLSVLSPGRLQLLNHLYRAEDERLPVND